MRKSKEGLVLLILGVVALALLLYVAYRGVGDRDASNAPPPGGDVAREAQ